MARRPGGPTVGHVLPTHRPDPHGPEARTDVLVAGGGTAALELLLALEARLGGTAHVTLLTQDARYHHRPLAAYGGAVPDAATVLRLDELAAEHGAGFVNDALASVEHRSDGTVVARTRSGAAIACRALVLAVGSRADDVLPGAIPLGARDGASRLRALADEVRAGTVGRVAVVVPPGVSWTLPAYECALLLRHAGAAHDVEVQVLTAEHRPMAIFGEAISATLATLLRRRGIELRTRTRAEAFSEGRLWVPLEPTIAVDAAVAMPRLAGPAIPGVPADAEGFATVDDRGRVVALAEDEDPVAGIWAIGDGADHPVKQGGLAVAQAETAAADIAAWLGTGDATPPPDGTLVLRAALLDGTGTLYLRADREEGGWRSTVSREPLWWPPTKIAGGRLAELLAGPTAPRPAPVA
jgi:sulfide:quinone oxidoreductase